MGRLLFLTFLVVPIIEIGIFIAVGQAIGLWPTLAGVVLTAMIGSFIIRVQGVSLIAEIQQLMGAGALPARQIADGVMLAIAGALLLTPGYFTDLLGFVLLVPAVRLLVYQGLKSRVSVVSGFSSGSAHQQPNTDGYSQTQSERKFPNDPDVVDLDQDKWR